MSHANTPAVGLPSHAAILRAIIIVATALMPVQAQIYVAPNGSDSNAGTIDQPLKTPQAAMAKVTGAGALIYLRDGVYPCSTQVKTAKDGVAGNMCRLFAYPGEHPILDFTGLNDRGVYLSKSYWHLKGIEVRHAGSNGICISSSGNNIIEGCIAHDNGLEGFKLTGTNAHDNLFLNCDSYRNYDAAGNGENADGFAAKTGTGPGNVFRGCRAWYNSDDGWDFYSNSTGNVLIDSCWAFRNGFNLWSDPNWQGDGDGFKLGGAGTTSEHTVTNSVAFDNRLSGFAQNHANAGQTIINCTGFRNAGNTFSFYETPTGGTLKHHTLKNCVSFAGNGVTLDPTAVQVTNSWQGVTVAVADFLSIDTALVIAPRNADYSLPASPFLRLASGSKLIDAGTIVGLPFKGAAPDLGAFEFDGITSVPAKKTPESAILLQNYPNPFNPSTKIEFRLERAGQVELAVYDLLGRRAALLVQGYLGAGRHQAVFNAAGISSGTYFVVLQAGGSRERISIHYVR